MKPTYTKKYVKQANAYGVFWEEKKDRKTIGYSEWFSSEEKCNEFINKQDEIQTKEK